MEFNAEAMGEHVLIRGRAVETPKVVDALIDMAEMYLVALWAMQMPCEDCPMRHGCMTSAALCGGTFCRQGFEALADEWRELWRAQQ